MKDYSWMKAVAFGKPLEHVKVPHGHAVCIARDERGSRMSDPYLFSILGFAQGQGSPTVIVNLEETILGDYCVSVVRTDDSGNSTKTIMAHLDFPPDYPAFREEAMGIVESALDGGSLEVREGLRHEETAPFFDIHAL